MLTVMWLVVLLAMLLIFSAVAVVAIVELDGWAKRRMVRSRSARRRGYMPVQR